MDTKQPSQQSVDQKQIFQNKKPLKLKTNSQVFNEDISMIQTNENSVQFTNKRLQQSQSQSTLPDIQNAQKPGYSTIQSQRKDLEFDYIGDYSSPTIQNYQKGLGTQNVVQNLKSLNEYMDKRFPKIKMGNQSQQDKAISQKKINGNTQHLPHKTQRNNYGDFYKNLMKPLGGKYVNKLTGALSPSSIHQNVGPNILKRNSSIFMVDANAPLQSNMKGSSNPIEHLTNARNSFVQMISLLTNGEKSVERLKNENSVQNEDQTLMINQQSLLDDTKIKVLQIDQSKLSNVIELNTLEEYRKKVDDNSVSLSLKNLSYEKPREIYKNYLKEQSQKSINNLHQSISQQSIAANTLREKITFKNHLKLFNEDSTFIEEFHKISDSIDKKNKLKGLNTSKKQSVDLASGIDSQNQQQYLLNCFKNLESEFGREDVQTFEKIIKDLLNDKLLVEDLISKDELELAMNQKLYSGFSMAPEIRVQIKESLRDEYDIDLEELELILGDKKYLKTMNQYHKKHLKSYKDTVKEAIKLKKVKDPEEYASVLEEFKIFRAKQKLKEQQLQKKLSKSILDEELGSPEQNTETKKKQTNERYTAFIVFMALQEMIKQVFVECKEKGQLMLKLFRKYFDEQEKNWFSIIQQLCYKIGKLKTDRSFLLNKFIDKKNKIIDNYYIKDQLQDVLDTKDVSELNLTNHKRIILELIGFVNREEDERYLMEVQKRNLENDVKEIIYNWDLVRSNLEFKEKLKKVNTQKIKEDFNLMDEVRQMKRDDQAVLVNLERMRSALSTGSIQWDLEKIQLEGQNHFFKDENQTIKQEMKKLRELYEISQETLQERSKENFDLQQRLKKFTQHLDIIEKNHCEVQTDVCFKNEEFTTSLDQILKNKLNNQLKKITKLMNKAKANVNRYQPMPKQEMMDLIQGVYIKKSQEINTKNEIHMEFDDFVYSVMIQRFGTKKKADHKGQEFLLALKKFSKEDERIDFFKKFIGFDEANPYSREVLEFYIMLMKATNESIQNIFQMQQDGNSYTPCEKIYIEFQNSFEKFIRVFNNSSSNLKEELKKHLIFDSELLIENQPKIEVKLNEKWELFALLIFLKNTMSQNAIAGNIEQALVEHFNIDEENNLVCAIDFETFKQHFIKIMGLEDSGIVFSVIDQEEFFKKYFGNLCYVEEEPGENLGKTLVKLRGLKKIFRERYEFKISLRKFMDLGMKMSIRFSEEAKEYYGKIFKVFDADGDGFITFKEFRKIIKKVDPQRSDWKIHAIYQKATGVDDSEKGNLKFNEFIKCAMNNVLMEKMIDWDKVLMEEKEEQNKELSYSQSTKNISLKNLGTMRDRKTMKLRINSNTPSSHNLGTNGNSGSAHNSGRSKQSTFFKINHMTKIFDQ